MDAEGRDLTRDEVHRFLVPLMRADNRTNVAYLLREYALLAAVLGSCAWLQWAWHAGRISPVVYSAAVPFGVLLAAIMQHRLSGLAHDASHYVLFRSRIANELVSDLLLMFPIVAMTQAYRDAHLGHHRWVNDPERDPDLVRLNTPVPQRFPVSKSGFWYRYVFKGLWPPSILLYLSGRARAANTTRGEAIPAVYRRRVARSLRGAYWLTVLAAIHSIGAWPLFLLFWVLPLLTLYPLLMQLREIAHHSNAPDDGDFTNSRVFRVHPMLAAAVFPYGQAFHLTHHLFAMVPHYRLPEAHRILMRYEPYRRNLVICRGYFFRTPGTDGPSVLDVLARGDASTPGANPPAPDGRPAGTTVAVPMNGRPFVHGPHASQAPGSTIRRRK